MLNFFNDGMGFPVCLRDSTLQLATAVLLGEVMRVNGNTGAAQHAATRSARRFSRLCCATA